MARVARDNLHSRLVSVFKIALPLLSLAILSTLFLISQRIAPGDFIPLTDDDLAERLREPRMTDAGYAGITKDGAALTINATEIRMGELGTNDGAEMRGLFGVLETTTGARTEFAAGKATLDATAGTVLMSGGVEITAPDGTIAQSEGLTVALDRTRLESVGRISAQGPIGQITADQFLMTDAPTDADPTGGYVMVFKGHVRLLYQPKQ